MSYARWQLIVPLKAAPGAKSRLAARPELARAIAWDTVAAAAAAARVARVIVVTADPVHRERFAAYPRVELVVESEPRGITAAIQAGLVATSPDLPRGVLLGDLPALAPAELDAALAAAEQHDRAFVRDADGTGTTLVTARGGVELFSSFGDGSADRHAAAALAEIPAAPESGLRRDVDTATDLGTARLLGLGPRTRAELAAAAAAVTSAEGGEEEGGEERPEGEAGMG